ncbi:MAG: thermonuclease family protein [Pseudomonadota bacterium]
MVRLGVWGLSFILAACAPKSPLPDMQPGETGRVVKIIDGDALVLETGQSVRLVSILAPVLRPREGPPEPHAAESARLLEDMVLGRRVQLYYPGLTRDRYDRALAHVVTADGAGPALWLNQAMVAAGGARVRLYAGTEARGRELLDAEADARERRAGLWSRAVYAVRDAERLAPEASGFVMLRARLGPRLPDRTDEDDRYRPACFRALTSVTLTLRIDADAQTVCDLETDQPVQIRGWLSRGVLDLRHPWHIELVEPL